MRILRMMVAAALLVLCATAAHAQPYVLQFGPASERIAGMVVSVWDPTGETCTQPPALGSAEVCTDGAYVVMTLEMLLDGLVDFPDGLRRCVALRAYDANDPDRPDDFGPSDFSGTHGLCRDGNAVGMPFPAVIPAGSLWISVAVPGTVGLPYISDGVVNFNENGAHFLTQQAGTITLDTGQTGYQVWTWTFPQFAGTASAVNYIYFLPRAGNPAP